MTWQPSLTPPTRTSGATTDPTARAQASTPDTFENVRYEPSDFIDAGDHVVVRTRQAGRGKASSVPVEEMIANVWKLRDGKCVEVRVYSTEREALEAVGCWSTGRSWRDTGRAMSAENIKVVERAIAALNERDVDGYLACCADDIQLRTPWSAVEGVYEGPEAIRRFFADLQDTGPDFRLSIERAEPIGADRVLVFVRTSLSGRASGIPAAAMRRGVTDPSGGTDVPTANVYDFAGGKIARVRIFVDRDEALKAAGLSA